MPKYIDESERKQQIAGAVWAIASEKGLAAATVRAVAAKCGLSVGAIQHSFSSQAQLQRFSMALLAHRAESRISLTAEKSSDDPLETVALLLEQLLPLDDERLLEARVWAMYSTSALTDPELRTYEREMDDAITAFCCNCMAYLAECGFLDTRPNDEIAKLLHAVLDGLTLRMLANPSPESAQEAQHQLRTFLRLPGANG